MENIVGQPEYNNGNEPQLHYWQKCNNEAILI